MLATNPPDEVDRDVFVVHAEDDTPLVKGELLPMLGLPDDRVILSSELPFPAFTEQAIEAAVRRSRLTLAVLSPAYLHDRWAGFAELLSRNVRNDARGGSLVPLLVADCEVPGILAQHELLDYRTPQQRQVATARLRARLEQPDPPVEQIACPYPGMQPFSAATASRFHGRTKEIEELLSRLQAGEREIFVIGTSGSGKSSLIAAGVLPRVRAEDALLGGLRFAVRTFRPGEHPMQRLAETHFCYLDHLESGLGCLLDLKQRDRLLIFIDQFEELFALVDAKERQDFVQALRVLRADRRCHLIVALRADFYGALMSSELWPDIDGRFTRLEVGPLLGDALREAIEAPARQAGVYLERDLVRQLMTDAAAEPGALPLLQEALVLLWARRSHRLLCLSSYEALGSDGRSGLAVALARRADAVLHDLTQSQQVLTRRILLRLVSFGEGRPDTRRQLPRAALLGSGDDAADVERVIDRLIDDRMLTSDTTLSGEPLIDLSHEALITGWPEFQRWLLIRRDDEQRRRQFELHAAEWVARGSGNIGLFDATRLAEAERWISSETAKELGYSNNLVSFLSASRHAIEQAEHHRRLALEQQERERRAAQEAIEQAERQRQLALEQQERDRQAAREASAKTRRRFARIAIIGLGLFSAISSYLWLDARKAKRNTLHQLGLNEQEQARSLIVEHADPISALPHLLQALTSGIDNTALRILLTNARPGLWRITFFHGTPVTAVTFSPDGTRIATADGHGAAYIWDAATGNRVGPPLIHDREINSVVFSSDGTRIVTASTDRTARIWDAAAGTPIGPPLRHQGTVNSAAFSPDGIHIVTASSDGTAQLWKVASGRPVGPPLKHRGGVYSAMFSADGTRVVTATGDGTGHLWDVATGTSIGAPLKHTQLIHTAEFSSDGVRVITASDDGTARLWGASTGSPIGTPLTHQKAVFSAMFSPDGTRVVTASQDGTAQLWNSATGEHIGAPLKHERAVNTAVFSPDGNHVMTVSNDGTARLWDSATGTPIGLPFRHEQPVRSAVFSPDGAHVVTASDDGTARLWDITSNDPASPLYQPTGSSTYAAFMPDGSGIITVDADAARLWDAATGDAISIPVKPKGTVRGAAFSLRHDHAVTAGDDHTATIWNIATGTPVGLPLKHQKAINSVAFSPNNVNVITAGSDGTARVWSTDSGEPISPPLQHSGPINSATFSPDSARLVTASSDGTARIWDTAGNPLAILKHEQAVASAAFSPGGDRIVTASFDTTARLWEAANGDPIGIVLKHEQAVWSAAFSPDGSCVATGSFDHTAQVWDAAAGNPLGLPFKHDGRVTGVAFSHDGARVLTLTEDGTARAWNVAEIRSIQTWEDQARKCLARRPNTAGLSRVCPLVDHEITPTDLMTRARSLVAAGDRGLYSQLWPTARSYYQRAISLLDRRNDLADANRGFSDFRRTVSMRIATSDAMAARIAEAHANAEPDAPADPTLLLTELGEFAHTQLHNDVIALELTRRAHVHKPDRHDILIRLAEVYFNLRLFPDLNRTMNQINTSLISRDERIVLAALDWATARLTHASEASSARYFMQLYGETPRGSPIRWSWQGTRHGLTYGRYSYSEVKPILDVLTLLAQPITGASCAQLAKLLQIHNPSESPAR